MPEIRWLYPTAEARKPHAFLPFTSDTPGVDEKQSGKRSLCGKYGRWRSDHGFTQPDGGHPKDACVACARAAEKIKGAR